VALINSSFLAWRGHQIHVTDTGGDGDPLLLLTGLGGNTDMWAPFRSQITSRRTICFDAPGTGRSSTPSQTVSVALMAELVTAVLDDRGLASADVVGFSYGGFVAQQLAFTYPDRVRRLVLAGTTCGFGGVLGSLGAMVALSTPLRFYSPSYFDRTAAGAYGGQTGRDAAARRLAMVLRHRHPPSAYGYALHVIACMGWSSLPFLTGIPHETLVISGDDDPLVPVANAEILARFIPNATLEIVKQAGHLFLWDQPQHAAERIGRFFDTAPITAR
jgi:pimeloyl-ACP methyl ester carboxylesterase